MKKMMSLILAFTMVMSLSVPTYAIEKTTESVEEKIQREIEETEIRVWRDLYNQLAAQDALDGIEYFKAALRPEIEKNVYEKYNIDQSRATNSLRYRFPNGGMVCYDGTLNTENVQLWMTKEQTLEYYYNTNKVSFVDYVEFVLNFVPGLQILTLANACKIVLKNIAQDNIEETDFYARLLYISWGSGAEQACYAYGWDTYPYAYVYDDAAVVTDVYYG